MRTEGAKRRDPPRHRDTLYPSIDREIGVAGWKFEIPSSGDFHRGREELCGFLVSLLLVTCVHERMM